MKAGSNTVQVRFQSWAIHKETGSRCAGNQSLFPFVRLHPDHNESEAALVTLAACLRQRLQFIRVVKEHDDFFGL
jgi:hypothetical protein